MMAGDRSRHDPHDAYKRRAREVQRLWRVGESNAAEHRYDRVDAAQAEIEQNLRLGVGLESQSYLICAATAVEMWTHIDRDHPAAAERRTRRQRFFTFIARAYELASGFRAGLTWSGNDRSSEAAVTGQFFEFAKICHDRLLPVGLQAENTIALAKLIERALKRPRSHPILPKKKRGRPRNPK
jgi:hypothetical protein